MTGDDDVRVVLGKTGLSASQEINLIQEGRRLHKIMTSQSLEPPLRLFAFDCTHNRWSLALSLLGYQVHAVERDPANALRPQKYLATSKLPMSCASLSLFQLAEQAEPDFDVAVINGAVFSELQTDEQLQRACEQISSKIRAHGLLLIADADHDDMLRAKERTWKPQITEDFEGRRINLGVRDWRGNGYEYSEINYVIEDRGPGPTVTCSVSSRRAWRRVEITLALQNTGFVNIEWQTQNHGPRIVVARKRGTENT